MRTVLVLHGYSQNATIMSKRLGALRKQCGSDVELVFVDAPHTIRPVDVAGQSSPDTLASFGAAEAAGAMEDSSLTPRAWWQSTADKTVAVGLKQSIESIRDVLTTRRFDGVLGFSQGAAFAVVITALLERPHFYPSFLVDGKTPHPPFGFCIVVSGFRLGDTAIQDLFSPPCSTYTLHVIGRTDVIVPPEATRILSEVTANRRVEEHDGGHFVPSKGNWRKFLGDFMKDPFTELPSPNSSTGGGANESALMMMKL